jgi:tetratricopeptide (TPR) repeat protein
MQQGIRRYVPLLLVALLLAAGCARSPEAKKARFLDRGDRYFKKEQYREAIIDYRNVLRIEGANARAIQQLGLAHYQLGEFGQAFRFLLKAQELTPDQIEVRVKLGTLYLRGRRFKETQDEASYVLAKDPKNLEALLLTASAAVTPEEVEAAIPQLEDARASLGDPPRLRVVLANLQLRKRNVAVAEALLQETVQKDPKSIEAHMALAELYLSKGDRGSAEREFQAAAAVAPAGSRARIRLADHYVLTRQPDEARKVLGEVTQKAPDYLPAWRRLAEIALVEGKLDDADKALETVLKKSPQDLDGHLLKGRVFLARKNSTQAVQEFQQVLKLEPRLPAARYQLALAYLQGGNIQQAKTELKEATTVSPNYLEAQLRLAQLNLETGAVDPAIEGLTHLVAVQPRLVEGYVLLGSAHLMKKDPAKAIEVYRKLAATAPKDPRGPFFVGLGLLAQGKRDEARKSLHDALVLAPGYVDPLVQLVQLDMVEKKPEAAVARVKRQIAAAPNSAPLQHLLGRTLEARREPALAETAYLKAIELDPRLVGPYLDLARVYGTSGRYDQALAKTDEALKANPRNLGALMLAGTLHERKGDNAKAEAAYARVLEINSRFAPAANNLAYLLGERDADMERALQLAQTAKEVAPDEPHISDTLGWILYKRGVYQRAVALLKESAARVPDNPVIQYHLGMAAVKAGDRETAKRALTVAAGSARPFPGQDDARTALRTLQ